MTQLEQFKAMLDAAEIEYKYPAYEDEKYTNVFEVQNKDGGYSGFCSEWHFTPDGNLIKVNHWE